MTGLRIERRGALMILTIDREDRRNALDSATSAALDQAVDEGERDPGVAVLILTAVGPRAFCSGMDMKEAAANGPGSGLIPGRGFGGITQRRRTKPLIAAINGAAVAGGFEIALACDIVIAADHAVFALAEVRHGMFAFSGGIQRLARMVPRQTALALILTGEPIGARRMVELGLASEVVPAADLLDRAIAIGEMIAAYPQEGVRNAKLLHDLAADAAIDDSLRFGRAWGEATLDGEAIRAGIAAFAGPKD
ncbi:enoyl-CoA hydratase-related protein [Sphingomonas sp.]|uniref:enoyl-CoA hydratase/isomerase family protein n=1 Tax=Sphingomonas sp. TaxID=28214 RepID=UPI0025F4E14E|nr:enoyl-CoA hydratase-related protein [Sphingomonas sp.]